MKGIRRLWHSLRSFLEERLFGTRLQEWIWRTRHLYRRNWAESYLDTVEHPHRQQIVDTIAGYSAGSVLEVGCASGANLVRLRERFPGVKLYGVDINARAIAVAKRHFRDDHAVVLQTGRADCIEFMPDKSVDLVFTDAVLMFVAEDKIRAVLSELGRIARCGIVFNEYQMQGASSYIGGRWIHDYAALMRELYPNCGVSSEPSAFHGGLWDDYGTLVTVYL